MKKGGFTIYGTTEVDKVLNATAIFDAENTDPKAQIITTLSGAVTGVTALVLFFYDGPDRPESFAPFDDLLITISTVKSQTFSDFVKGIPSELAINARGAFHTMSTSSLTPKFLDAVKNETEVLGKFMALHSGTVVSYDIEPFLHNFGEKATDSAFPHTQSPLPLNLYFAWISEADDDFWHDAMRTSAETLVNVAIKEGIYLEEFTMYPNYALFDTSAEDLYGQRNAARLRQIRERVDPEDVMGLAGGFMI
ncbi:hypothetical protein MPH_02911 [Macrophomina phaseolina MS6]|uniref:Uncharacterized protein n=1 Tax=Macrophomina phaseolina (strain MS6) TaxID=1126212 RepID=K2SSQ4_MACPH|nr:hypothetical protein MPH_02911 [Macrophomina phaseolina MS6]